MAKKKTNGKQVPVVTTDKEEVVEPIKGQTSEPAKEAIVETPEAIVEPTTDTVEEVEPVKEETPEAIDEPVKVPTPVKAPVAKTNIVMPAFKNFETAVSTGGLMSNRGADSCYSLLESVRIAVKKSNDNGVTVLKYIAKEFRANKTAYLSPKVIGASENYWTRDTESKDAYFALMSVFTAIATKTAGNFEKSKILSQFRGKYSELGTAVANYL